MRAMRIEIDTPERLRAHLTEHESLIGTVVQGLDLRGHTDAILAAPVTGAVFLGCQLSEDATAHVLATGGTLFPVLDDLPYRPFRPTLYDVNELMNGYRRGSPESFADTTDQRIYAHFDALRTAGPMPVLDALAQRLHDHAIDDALEDYLRAEPRAVVAIMGGHAMGRGDPAYAQVARVAQRLVQRDTNTIMASGGGPGAMEATHVGAWLGRRDDAALTAAIETLRRCPGYRDAGWLDSAFEVRERFSKPCESLAMPTWFYGHEPTNLFATHIAKYFSNSLREDGLLAIATRGVVYAPGSAGTVQEIFMDAAQNHYGTFGVVSPMVFLGKRYWSEERPVLPLLRALSQGRQYADAIMVTDDADEAVTFIVEHLPVPYAG